MSRFGKCQNFSGCLLAYRGEELQIEGSQPFICPECGKALTEAKPPSALWLRYVYGLAACLVIAGIAFFAFPQLRGLVEKRKKHDDESAPAPAQQENPQTALVTPATDLEPSGDLTPDPPAPVVAPAKIDLDLSKGENKEVKAEVLKRIDLMPMVSAGNKDRLYSSVERARSMGKILTIPFSSAKSELAGANLQTLKTELEKPDVAKLREDPTAVFVILGYADPKGDPKKNIAVSQARADAVQRAMREKCGVLNVLHTVAMGGSKLLDEQNLEKNRIVEIWAVLP